MSIIKPISLPVALPVGQLGLTQALRKGVPANAIKLNGQFVKLNGQFVTLSR